MYSAADCDWLYTELSACDRGRMISPRELTLIARDLPSLLAVGRCLGFSDGRLQQLRGANPHSVAVQASELLGAWRAKTGSGATVETLVGCLREADVDEEVYRGVIVRNSRRPDGRGDEVFV